MGDFVVVSFVERQDTVRLVFTCGYKVPLRYASHATKYGESHAMKMYHQFVSCF